MNKESTGALIDAIYAIAATLLALEIPATITKGAGFIAFWSLVLDYAITFLILFALWVQHRRINGHLGELTPLALWLNAFALMMVCLIPRATVLVFEHGGDVTVMSIERILFHGETLHLAEWVNLFFVVLVLGVDLCLLVLSRQVLRRADDLEAREVWRSKVIISTLVIGLLSLSFLISVQQRVFLALLPVALMFESRLSRVVQHWWGR